MPNYRSTPHWRGQSTVISHQYNAPPPLHCHTLHIPMLWIVAETETLWPLKIQDYIKYWRHLKMSQPSGVTGISWNSISASNWNRHNKFLSEIIVFSILSVGLCAQNVWLKRSLSVFGTLTPALWLLEETAAGGGWRWSVSPVWLSYLSAPLQQSLSAPVWFW